MKKLFLEFYGVNLQIESDDTRLLDLVIHDFNYFITAGKKCEFLIRYHKKTPEYSHLPIMSASLATPRNICFRDKDITYIDYFGKALNVYKKKEKQCDIYTDKIKLGHEIVFLTILSRVSNLLDNKGFHRIHALGLEYHGKGILVLLPSGGGKTTLAMQILNSTANDIKLISEDSPMIDSNGNLYPFPIRIGLLPEQIPEGIDDKFINYYERMEFGPKITINLSYFKNRISNNPVSPWIILLGERSTGEIAQIKSAPKSSIIKYILMSSIIGVGLYQGLEFILQKNLSNTFKTAQVILSRTKNNFKMINKSHIFKFTIGRNKQKNINTLISLIENFDK